MTSKLHLDFYRLYLINDHFLQFNPAPSVAVSGTVYHDPFPPMPVNNHIVFNMLQKCTFCSVTVINSFNFELTII